MLLIKIIIFRYFAFFLELINFLFFYFLFIYYLFCARLFPGTQVRTVRIGSYAPDICKAWAGKVKCNRFFGLRIESRGKIRIRVLRSRLPPSLLCFLLRYAL